MADRATTSREHQSWLDRGAEEALEPDLEICDPHHHLWDFPGSRYLLDEIVADLGSGHRVRETVFVECTAFYRETGPLDLRCVGETEHVDGIADRAARREGSPAVAAGIIGLADLTLGDRLEAVLDAHQAASRRFRGIRHAAGWDASPEVRNSHTDPPSGLMRSAAFRDGVARLGRRGLLFEAWLYHPQLGDLVDLARRVPETTVVLDHLGGPLGIGPYAGRRDQVRGDWLRQLTALAACDNVSVKLGGLGMPICGFGFHHRDSPPSSSELERAWRPYVEPAIELFGVERAMFESNFPVDRRSCSYAVLWNAFKLLAAGASPRERAALFRDTARSVYDLGPS